MDDSSSRSSGYDGSAGFGPVLYHGIYAVTAPGMIRSRLVRHIDAQRLSAGIAGRWLSAPNPQSWGRHCLALPGKAKRSPRIGGQGAENVAGAPLRLAGQPCQCLLGGGVVGIQRQHRIQLCHGPIDIAGLFVDGCSP